MEDIIRLLFFLVVGAIWIASAVVKKAREQKGSAAPRQRQQQADGKVYAAGQDEVRAFLERMGAVQPGRQNQAPPPRPVALPQQAARAAAAHSGMSAADALRAAAARRAAGGKAKPPAPAVPAEREPVDREVTARRRKPPARTMPAGSRVLELTGLSAMQRAIVLKEILDSPVGLGPDPLRREM